MASDVDIANRALTKLGAARIGAFNEQNKQARAVESMFDIVRDAELRAHIWAFSVKRDTLTVDTNSPDWGFNFQYVIPTDCLRIIQVNEFYPGPDMSDYRNMSTAEYQIEGGFILSHEADDLKVRYISQVTDTTKWDSTFVEAFACKLAVELAEDLTQSNTKRQLAWDEYKQALTTAIRSGAIEQQHTDMPDDSWMLSRI